MRATCSICTELFTSESDISAVPCGHTFHEHCLSQWFRESKTCPQCRVKVVLKSVINRLFFTEDDSAPGEPDVNKIKNECDTLRTNLREKEREKARLAENAESLEKRVKGLEDTVSSVKVLLQQEKSKNDTLKRELVYAKKVQSEVSEARTEANTLREKLKSLRTVEDLVKGMIPDIEQKARNASADDLAKWCVIQEKELKRKKNDCHKLQDEQRIRNRELVKVKHLLEERTSKLEIAQDRLKASKEDVSSLESQNASLKKKLEALQSSVGSPNSLGTSLAHRLINESPAPALPTKRPRLSLPDESMGSVDLDMTSEILPAKRDKQGQKENQQKSSCKEFGTKYVKISSAAGSGTTKVKSASDISNLPGLGNLNILKKTINQGSLMTQEASSIKRGYNGMGGHEKFVQAQGRPFLQAKPKLKKTAATSKVFKPSLSKPPPFPSLNAFDMG